MSIMAATSADLWTESVYTLLRTTQFGILDIHVLY